MAEFDDIINDDEGNDVTDTPIEEKGASEIDAFEKKEKEKDNKPDYSKYLSGEDEEDKSDRILAREEEILSEFNLTKEELEEARKMGWKDKNGFEERNGKKFVGPKEFLDKAKDNSRIYKERFEASQKKIQEQDAMISGLTDKVTKIIKGQYDTALSEKDRLIESLKAQIKEAKDTFEYDKIEELAAKKVKVESEKENLTKEAEKLSSDEKKIVESKKSAEDKLIQEYGADNIATWKENTDEKLEATWRKESPVWKEIENDPEKFIQFKDYMGLLIKKYPNLSSAKRIEFFDKKFSEKKENSSIVDSSNSFSSAQTGKTGWESLSKGEKDIAISVAKNFKWWKDKDTNPDSKKRWESYKAYYDKKDEE